ncbi:hypothetical protein DTO96_102538 [Ephemeroptericola cinctiostellae]|uniref:DUF1353 domain-containing protein n=1 Tax=Ephemeroptericola cinctiostellae TaxID=2268024 RepID=A0A345DEJ4_9BURK|nr:DUF1353 domain-containing protein [Ephemeroptericola cinctiostellae]AXF86782.1 hypothetical protein DTO96_102538 [Ephemeroptericola cinctiostellae]
MSAFTTPAVLEMLDRYRWRLAEPFMYYTDVLPSRTVIAVPVDTITDLASVPRILWVIFPPIGRYAKAAIVHDYLYEQALYSKPVADMVFYEAMGVLGVPKWRRWLMYQAVKWFGRGNYEKRKRDGF